MNIIPGLSEAVKRESDIRDVSFLDLTTTICGIEIRQMTPLDMMVLDGVGNPLMYGRIPSPVQLSFFLWKLSPKFRNNAPFRRFIFASQVEWGIRGVNLPLAVAECRKYIADTFQDAPAGPEEQSTPYAGWCAHIVNNIASSYGWSEAEILNTPLKRLFQYLRCIRRNNNPNAPMFNASDKVKGDYLRMQNARASLIKVLKSRLN